MSPFEIVGVLFGVASVYLTVRESIWCWPTGIVNVGLFIVVFYQTKLYSDMGLQVVYLALCAYGWYEWLHGGTNRGALAVARTPRAALAGLLAAGLLGSVLLGATLARTTDASLPFIDSTLTAFSLVAQAMLTRKWIENWIVWILVDVVYVGVYIYKDLYLTSGLYAVFLILAVLGMREWRRTLVAPARA